MSTSSRAEVQYNCRAEVQYNCRAEVQYNCRLVSFRAAELARHERFHVLASSRIPREGILPTRWAKTRQINQIKSNIYFRVLPHTKN